jgi:hypothetical protein
VRQEGLGKLKKLIHLIVPKPATIRLEESTKFTMKIYGPSALTSTHAQ